MDLTTISAAPTPPSRSRPPQLLAGDYDDHERFVIEPFSPLRDGFRKYFGWVDDKESIAWRVAECFPSNDNPAARVASAADLYEEATKVWQEEREENPWEFVEPPAAEERVKQLIGDRGVSHRIDKQVRRKREVGEQWGAPELEFLLCEFREAKIEDSVAADVRSLKIENRRDSCERVLTELFTTITSLPQSLATWLAHAVKPWEGRYVQFDALQTGDPQRIWDARFRFAWNLNLPALTDDAVAAIARQVLISPRALLAVSVTRLVFFEALSQTRRMQCIIQRADNILVESYPEGLAPSLADLTRTGYPLALSPLERIVKEASASVWPTSSFLERARASEARLSSIRAHTSNLVVKGVKRDLEVRDLHTVYDHVKMDTSRPIGAAPTPIESLLKAVSVLYKRTPATQTILNRIKNHRDFACITRRALAAAFDADEIKKAKNGA